MRFGLVCWRFAYYDGLTMNNNFQLRVFSGRANVPLAEKIAQCLGDSLGKIRIVPDAMQINQAEAAVRAAQIAFDSAKRGWITTDDGFLLSTDGGDTWKPTTAGAATEGQTQLFLSKLMRAGGTTWALGPFGLAKQTGDGTQWKKIDNPLTGMA